MSVFRRILARAGVCLALGLVTTIAVAWGCAAWSTLGPKSTTHIAPTLADGSPDLASLGTIATLIDPNWLPRPGAGYTVTVDTSTQHGFGLCDTALTIMHWSHHEGSGNGVVWLHRAGWPFPAMRCAFILRGNSWVWESSWTPPGALVRRTYPLQTPPAQVPRPPLPLRPDSPGFTANTLFFAALWSLLLFARRAMRTRLRRSRSLCPRCGYSRAGLGTEAPCPECGINAGVEA